MPQPLNELLSCAMTAFGAEFARATDPQRQVLSLDIHANLLRPLAADETDLAEIAKLARVSKRAVKWNVGLGTRLGWVEAEGKRVRLTAEGQKAYGLGERRVRSVEARWRKRFGNDVLKQLRSSLEAVVGRFDLELPHHPAGYGPADGSVTGGVSGRFGRRHALRVNGAPGGFFDPAVEYEAAEAWERDSGGKLYVRDRGQDWRPVPRGDGDTVSTLPLYALLSQAVMAFAIDYESCGGLSMGRSGNVLRHIDDAGNDVEVRPSQSKGSAPFIPVDSNLAGLERHDYAEIVDIERDGRHGRLVLTKKGSRVRDSYDQIVVDIEARWKRRYGASVIRALRGALTAMQSGP